MNYDIKSSGERIRQLRIEGGYTQEKLAETLNIDRSLLSHVEAGKRGCSVDLLIHFSDFFKVPLDFLILGRTYIESSCVNSREQISEEIDILISHLEIFKEYLNLECDK